MTQGNNANFLPASAPSMQAANLAAPFRTPLASALVLAARTAALTAADKMSRLAGLGQKDCARCAR